MQLLTEVYKGVLVEPPLQSLTGERLSYASANCQDHARVDTCTCIAADGFWNQASLLSCHRRNESDKRRCYDQAMEHVPLHELSGHHSCTCTCTCRCMG